MQIKIGIIIVYFGQWPDWIYYFIRSCERNAEFDFILFNDSQTLLSHSRNIRNISFTLDEFNLLATKKLGFKVRINNPYKICDFKPAIGKIFEEYIREYDYWGVSDVDLIFGDLSQLITGILNCNYDLISFYKGFISAPFFLVRNTAYLNSIFEQINDYRIFLCMNEYCGIDENNKSGGRTPVIIKRTLNIIKFLFGNLICFNLFKLSNKELKYNLYWYLKKKGMKIPADFTEVVHLLSEERKIKSLFLEIMESDRSLYRKGINKWKVEYIARNAYISNLKKEILIFHFPESKNNKNFRVLNYPGNFIITPDGILKYE